jgi:uridine kinase
MSEYEVVEPSNIIIVEGIMAFAFDKLLPLYDIKIFVDTADDIRFIRRLKRDMSDRGRTLESVVDQYMDTVRPMHHAFVEPSKKYADIIVPEGGHNNIAFGMLMSMIEKLQNK